jgi:hypothetical protein
LWILTLPLNRRDAGDLCGEVRIYGGAEIPRVEADRVPIRVLPFRL